MKKIARMAILLMVVLTMAGCSKAEMAEQADGIVIGKDGKITGTLVNVLDQSYYDSEELKNMIETEIADTNAKQGADAVTLESYNCDNSGKVKVKLVYADNDAYQAFNNTTFFSGTSVTANELYGLKGNFLNVQDGKVTTEDAVVTEDSKVVVVSENVNVTVPGKIIAVTDNVEITGKKTASVNVEKEDESEDESEEELAYIVYR